MKYLAITAILCLILAGASFAGEVVMTDVITGGNLTLTMPSDFSITIDTTIGGASVKYPYNSSHGNYTIEDSRGTGAGWNLGFQISQFQTGGTPNRTLTEESDIFINYNNITCVYGQAKDATNGPISLFTSATIVQTSEVKGVQALAGYGMGKYTIANLQLRTKLYAYTYAGTYTATLTATLNNVP